MSLRTVDMAATEVNEKQTEPPSRIARDRLSRLILSVGTPAALLATWQILYELGVANPRYTSAPSEIWAAALEYARSGNLLNDLSATGRAFVPGYLLSVVIGVPVGILVGWYRRGGYALNPMIAFFYATPRIALMPLFMIWFGIGISSKVALVVGLAVFPLIVNTEAGIKSLDPDIVRVARVFKASDMQIFRTIALPGALPSVVSGARLAIGLGLIGVVVAEMQVATEGVGYRMVQSASFARTDLVLVGVAIISVAGVMLSALLRALEFRLSRWRQVE